MQIREEAIRRQRHAGGAGLRQMGARSEKLAVEKKMAESDIIG